MNGDAAYRQPTEGDKFTLAPSSHKAQKDNGRVALVIRRETAIDKAHERGALGQRYWSDRPLCLQWESYNMATSGIQMRGGRLYKLSATKKVLGQYPDGRPQYGDAESIMA
jgi:hypothetical protein